jgi:hypothetical protein
MNLDSRNSARAVSLACDRANGYPRNPIDGVTWSEGHELAQVCDRFADAVQKQGNRSGEEQAAGLATAIACQVVGHYPEEIFPRVLRTAKCREANGKSDKAIDDYLAILGDFRHLELEFMLDDEEALQDSERCVLTCLVEAIEALERLAPARLGDVGAELKAKAITRCLQKGGPGTTDGR